MVEWVAIGIVIFTLILIYGGIRMSWNIAQGTQDILEFFGAAGRPGTSREHKGSSSDQFGAEGKKFKSSTRFGIAMG